MITTKSALARELGCNRAAVAYWCRKGLPTLADGRLDRDEAITWIATHISPQVGSTGLKGAAQAATLCAAEASSPQDEESPWADSAQEAAVRVAIAAIDLAGIARVDADLVIAVANAALQGASEAAKDLAAWMAAQRKA
jgi:hypothetical protein